MTQPAIVKPANGVVGHILCMLEGGCIFRVYDYRDKTIFIDYDLCHSDLCVQIKDPDAFFYLNSTGLAILDHSPKTLSK